MRLIRRAGFLRMYMRKASDDQRPRACIRDGEAPNSARKVAPPARMDSPPNSAPKKRRKRRMKNERVGTAPSDLSHRGECNGMSVSRDER